MNRQFPCILKGSYIWLAFDKRNATTLDSDHGANKGNINFEHDGFDNITTEYLANTYGEVKSKEHAEFIVELAEGHGYTLTGMVKSWEAGAFVVNGDSKSVFFMLGGGSLSGSTALKKITIPLPPECEEKTYRYEGIGQKPKHFDCICTKCGGRCCIGNCDEWPKVGDDVVLDGEDGIVKLPADAQDYYIVEVNGLYKQCKFGELSKPKTPEEKEREDIESRFKELFRLAMGNPLALITGDVDKIVEHIFENFDIKKKPQ